MTPSFSLRRISDHRRYFYARVALDPRQALSLCIGCWVSTDTWGEMPGIREQFAQQRWVGTEITTDSDARHIAVSSVFGEISPFDVFPSVAPRNVKRARQENTPVLIASHSYSVTGRPTNELWCYEARILRDERQDTDAFIDMSFREFAGGLQCQGLLLEASRFFHGGDLPKDHLFTRENVLSMRKAAKRESRHKR